MCPLSPPWLSQNKPLQITIPALKHLITLFLDNAILANLPIGKNQLQLQDVLMV